MLQMRRLQSTLHLVKRSLWTGSESLSESDPEMYNLLKLEKKRQVYKLRDENIFPTQI
jgi:hypothetical protein